jgi:hypothetical protein
MKGLHAVSYKIITTIAMSLMTPTGVMAQASDAAASTPKQVQKAQRKADRKARREKKNAELKTLKQNGFNPGGDQADYPQNLQNAERKTQAQKAGKTTPAPQPRTKRQVLRSTGLGSLIARDTPMIFRSRCTSLSLKDRSRGGSAVRTSTCYHPRTSAHGRSGSAVA